MSDLLKYDLLGASKAIKAKEFSSESRLASVIIQGRTEANRSVLISSETNGIVQSILADKGDQVKKDQIICKLSVDSRKAKLDAKKISKDSTFTNN